MAACFRPVIEVGGDMYGWLRMKARPDIFLDRRRHGPWRFRCPSDHFDQAAFSSRHGRERFARCGHAGGE